MSRPMRREEAVVEAPVTTVTVSDYAHQAYMILLVAFVVAPIVSGLDKYFNILTDWTRYLSPIVPSRTGIAASTFMMIVGAVEIVGGADSCVQAGFWWLPSHALALGNHSKSSPDSGFLRCCVA